MTFTFNLLRNIPRASQVGRVQLRGATSQFAAFRVRIPASPDTSSQFTAKRFTKQHEYVIYDDETNIGTIGITNHAQESLGDVVFVELPAPGSVVKQGAAPVEQIGAVESVKAASDIYAPLAGHVEAVNDELSEQPNLLNKSPEEDGWLCKVRVTAPEQFNELLNEETYTSLFAAEE
ncbi:hypothetical protein E3Q22_00597 [Wallemia mellicola]|uniref:Glycine cleavage system H protein n=1 Tax=Wallemia mellicola TaxID=1708541 RepID=A0A4T0MHG9_9BASI|nr:hypothetical protein E3Q24_01779 [Wallemia mellicola]TIB72561.1 hypothetical protein E3Q23_03358 [Wallemia mellicola]TIB81876.1 hypothetical protein E3Q22_00597 [Wallemia mellicola]TIB86126.1 hypothetical protein E3Q21_01782 [Wallemia mellicola]TIB89274.1 hypothetical protein E3Q20_01775 [Wallemia mellicola]